MFFSKKNNILKISKRYFTTGKHVLHMDFDDQPIMHAWSDTESDTESADITI